MSEPRLVGHITLDLGDNDGITFNPEGHISRPSATGLGRTFAVLDITSAFYLAAGSPTTLDRLAEAATSLAGDLRAALAAEQSGGAS